MFRNKLFTIHSAIYYLHIIKDSKISQKIRRRFQYTNILLIWSLYNSNQQKSRQQIVGFYKKLQNE